MNNTPAIQNTDIQSYPQLSQEFVGLPLNERFDLLDKYIFSKEIFELSKNNENEQIDEKEKLVKCRKQICRHCHGLRNVYNSYGSLIDTYCKGCYNEIKRRLDNMIVAENTDTAVFLIDDNKEIQLLFTTKKILEAIKEKRKDLTVLNSKYSEFGDMAELDEFVLTTIKQLLKANINPKILPLRNKTNKQIIDTEKLRFVPTNDAKLKEYFLLGN